MPNDNENKPVSFNRAKAEKTGKAKYWGIKDALEYTLDLIAKGELAENDIGIIVIAEKPDDDINRQYHFISAVPNNLVGSGLTVQAQKYFTE